MNLVVWIPVAIPPESGSDFIPHPRADLVKFIARPKLLDLGGDIFSVKVLFDNFFLRCYRLSSIFAVTTYKIDTTRYFSGESTLIAEAKYKKLIFSPTKVAMKRMAHRGISERLYF